MVIDIRPNSNGKYTAKVGDKVIGDKYCSASKACEKVMKYLKGQNR